MNNTLLDQMMPAFPPPASPPFQDGAFPLPLTLAMAATAFIAETAFGVTGFGPSIIFLVSSRLCHIAFGLGGDSGTLISALDAMSSCDFVAGIAAAATQWRNANYKWVGWQSLLLVAGNVLGILLLEHLQPYTTWLSRAAGALLVVVAVHRVADLAGCGKKLEAPRDPASVPDLRRPRVLLSTLLFFVGGLMGGLLSVPGPPAMIVRRSWGARPRESQQSVS